MLAWGRFHSPLTRELVLDDQPRRPTAPPAAVSRVAAEDCLERLLFDQDH